MPPKWRWAVRPAPFCVFKWRWAVRLTPTMFPEWRWAVRPAPFWVQFLGCELFMTIYRVHTASLAARLVLHCQPMTDSPPRPTVLKSCIDRSIAHVGRSIALNWHCETYRVVFVSKVCVVYSPRPEHYEALVLLVGRSDKNVAPGAT